MSKDTDDFYGWLKRHLPKVAASFAPTIERIGNVGSNTMRVFRLGEADNPDSQPVSLISARKPTTANRAVVLTVDDKTKVGLRLLEPGESDIGTNADQFAAGNHTHSYQPLGVKNHPTGSGGSGRFWGLGNLCGLGALTAMAASVADRVYYVPVFISDDRTMDAITFEVTTVVSGSISVGIYDNLTTALLPNNRLVQSAKTAVSTTGVKTFTFTPTALPGGQWYWLAIIATTAMAYRGSATSANLPNIRGWTSTNLQDVVVMCNEDISAGWSGLPATASPSSGPSNLYYHMGVRG